MFRAAILLFLIIACVIAAWLPSNVFEEDVISKYRANQNAMNQHLNIESEQNTATEIQQEQTSSPKDLKQNSQAIPTSKVAIGNLSGESIPTDNTIEQTNYNSKTTAKPRIDNRRLHPLHELFEKTEIGSQFYDIDNQQANTIVSSGGALINIPPNCFMQQDGSMVVGNVTIEIKEINTKSEYLLSNITTNTFNSLLSSDGLIYFNAYLQEQNLKIAPQKLLYVELPTKIRDGDKRAFFAEFDKAGQSWWTKSMPQVNRMISLPLQQMLFDEMNLSTEIKDYLKQPKFEQTFIATRAFEERLRVLQQYQDLFSIEEVINIYTKHVDSDLKELDNKVAYYFNHLAKEQIEHSTISKKLQKLNNRFQYFALERYTKPLYLRPYNVDLNESNAYYQLLANGMSAFTANMYIQMNNCRKHLVAQRSKNRKMVASKKRSKNTFMVHHIGWFSINEFLPTATPKRKIMAQVNSANHSKTSLYLVLEDFNTVVAANKDKEGNYHFNSLPLGANGRLVALSYKHNQPFIDIQDIIVGEKYLHSLQMRPTTVEMMQYEISQLDYERHLSASL